MFQADPSLDILCIGEAAAGKTHFLRAFAEETPDDPYYTIYTKIINNTVVYFHQLSEQEELYLGLNYDGVLFFVDLVNHWKVEENILKWLEIHSKCTGRNIFKIPFLMMVMKANEPSKRTQKWKSTLADQISSLIELNQIIYYDDKDAGCSGISNFIQKIKQDRAAGIKCTNYTLWKLYGVSDILKNLVIGFKLTLFRTVEVLNRHRKKINIY